MASPRLPIVVGLVYLAAFLVLRPDVEPETWEAGEIAEHLLGGNGYAATGVDGRPEPTANQMPVYALLLAAFLKWLPAPLVFLYALQALVWLLAARALAGLAHRLVGSPESWTFLVVALWPPMLLYVLQYHPLTLRAAALVFALVAADACRRRPSSKRAVGLGVALGAAALVRSTFLVLPLILVPWSIRARYRHAAISVAVIVVVLSPWVLRNRIVFDAWVPGTTTAGQMARTGNHPDASGVLDDASLRRTMLELPRELWSQPEPARDAFFRSKVAQFWQEHPLDAAWLYAKKLVYLWTWQPGVGSRYSNAATWGYLALWLGTLVMIVAGWTLARRDPRADAPSLFLGTWTLLSLVYALFAVNMRYRFEAEPLLVPYAVVAARGVILYWRARPT